MDKMASIVKEKVGDNRIHAGITHNNAPESAQQLRKIILSQLHCDELHVFEALAPAAVHTGQGLVDFGFYSSD